MFSARQGAGGIPWNPDEFVITISTGASGEFTFPGIGTYDINFGESTSTWQTVTNSATNYYSSTGTYVVRAKNGLQSIKFISSASNANKLISLENWSNIAWTSMDYAFGNCRNFAKINAIDIPNLGNVSNAQGMFANCRVLVNPKLQNWDVSNITNMREMFTYTLLFNGYGIESWDVGNVIDMTRMFDTSRIANVNLNSWDISNTTSTSRMFQQATLFNGNISNWNTINITDMSYMFSVQFVPLLSQGVFNGNINSWNTANVTNMSYMFEGQITYNQPLSNWNISKVTNISGMFSDAFDFNQNINVWDTANVIDMSYTFASQRSTGGTIPPWPMDFNQPLDNWNTSKVTTMSNMFKDCINFNQDITGWNVANVVYMNYICGRATAFNQDISVWNLDNIQNMSYAFYGTSMNKDLGNLLVTALPDGGSMNNMLSYAGYVNTSSIAMANASKTIIGWANQVYANGGNPKTVNFDFTNFTIDSNVYSGSPFTTYIDAYYYLTTATVGWIS